MSKLRPTYAFMKRLEFLSSGRLYLKDAVKVIVLAYNTRGGSSKGIREFIAERLPPVQFKNPNVQVVLLRNTGALPAVKVFYSDGRKVMLDVEDKEADSILQELSSIAGKLESQVQQAQRAAEDNPANFGDRRRGRLCMCEVPGQVPCPAKVPIKNVEHKWHEKNNQT